MEEQIYKNQRIRFEVVQTHGATHWTATAEVYFNNARTLRIFEVPGIPEKFASRDEAEQCVIEAAKRLIDGLI